MYNRLHTIPACDKQKETSCHSIVRAMYMCHVVKFPVHSDGPMHILILFTQWTLLGLTQFQLAIIIMQGR